MQNKTTTNLKYLPAIQYLLTRQAIMSSPVISYEIMYITICTLPLQEYT